MFLNCTASFHVTARNISWSFKQLLFRGKFLYFHKSIPNNTFPSNSIVLFNNFYLDLYTIECRDTVMFGSTCSDLHLYLEKLWSVWYYTSWSFFTHFALKRSYLIDLIFFNMCNIWSKHASFNVNYITNIFQYGPQTPQELLSMRCHRHWYYWDGVCILNIRGVPDKSAGCDA